MTGVARLRRALALPDAATPMLVADDGFDDDGSDHHGGVTPAAVLVPVVLRPEPTLILTVRPETLRQHAGQIAFPGGRIDPGDADAVDAALREAEEEIGLPRDQVEVIGTTDRYRTVTGFEVTPVVGLVPPGVALRPNEAEVAAIFEVPLDFVLHAENQVERAMEWRGRTRHYYEIMWQDRRIWGATAAMIVNLGRRMVLAT